LRLSSQIKIKPVHFISTLSVFSASDFSRNPVILESDIPDGQLTEGYAQTKWVAEQLVLQARERGLLTSIYRPSRITGHSYTGVSNKDDFFCRAVKGFIQLGLLSPLEGITDNIIPVDYLSRAILHLSQQPESLGKNFHLLNPNSHYVADIFRWFHSVGYPLKLTSYAQWRSNLVNSVDNVLQPLLPIFPEAEAEESPFEKELPIEEVLFEKAELPFNYQNVIDGLANTAMVCPPAEPLLKTYYSYFRRCGFLEVPQHSLMHK
jgi:thioester reductase-like protein